MTIDLHACTWCTTTARLHLPPDLYLPCQPCMPHWRLPSLRGACKPRVHACIWRMHMAHACMPSSKSVVAQCCDPSPCTPCPPPPFRWRPTWRRPWAQSAWRRCQPPSPPRPSAQPLGSTRSAPTRRCTPAIPPPPCMHAPAAMHGLPSAHQSAHGHCHTAGMRNAMPGTTSTARAGAHAGRPGAATILGHIARGACTQSGAAQ